MKQFKPFLKYSFTNVVFRSDSILVSLYYHKTDPKYNKYRSILKGNLRSSILLTLYYQLNLQTSVSISTFTTLWANLADDTLMIFCLFFPEKHFMQVVSTGDNFQLLVFIYSGTQ